jgi:AraC-like DNA-binding protein
MQKQKYTRGRKQLCERETIEIPGKCRERFLSITSPLLRGLYESGIRFSGMSRLVDGYHIKRIDPRWHSLIYTFGGNGRLETAGNEHVLHPGSLYIAPAHCPHEYWIREAPWHIAWFCMEEENGFDCTPSEPMVLVSPSSNLLSSIVENLIEAQSAIVDSPAILDYAIPLLVSILGNDTESARASRQQKQKQRLDSAFSEVHRDPSFDWSISALIDKGHLPFGEDRLRQLCVEFYGQSPMKRVKSIRMQIARELLRATNYPLRTIAPMVGYKNEFAFSTAFHKETGESPKDFRQGAGE